MRVNETVVRLGASRSLVGIIAHPDEESSRNDRIAVVILNAGLVHRVGPHRISVKLARRLAIQGVYVLRLDFSGIGDSPAQADTTPFARRSVEEIRQAMDALTLKLGVDQFVLMGLCSGADIAFHAAGCDRRVVGVVAINGVLVKQTQIPGLAKRLEDSVRRRYYRRRILDPSSWHRFVTGKSNVRGMAETLANRLRPGKLSGKALENHIDVWASMTSLLERRVNIQLIYSEGSKALDGYRLILEPHLATRAQVHNPSVHIMNGVDHVFTLLSSQETLIRVILQWTRTTLAKRAHADSRG